MTRPFRERRRRERRGREASEGESTLGVDRSDVLSGQSELGGSQVLCQSTLVELIAATFRGMNTQTRPAWDCVTKMPRNGQGGLLGGSVWGGSPMPVVRALRNKVLGVDVATVPWMSGSSFE